MAVSLPLRMRASSPGIFSRLLVQDGNYNAFPDLARITNSSGNSVLLLPYRVGASHIANNGVIWLLTSVDRGFSWSSPSIFYDPGVAGTDAREGKILPLSDGSILFSFWVALNNLTEGHSYLMRGIPDAAGTSFTWGSPVEIGSSTHSPPIVAVSGKCEKLANGTYLAPVYYANVSGAYGAAVVPFTISGATITPSAQIVVGLPASGNEFSEWTPLQLRSGRIVGLIRQDTGTPGFARVISDDNGATWTTPAIVISTTAALGQPNFIELPDGGLFLLTRGTAFATVYGKSTDAEGATWPALTTYSTLNGEYAGIVLGGDGIVDAAIASEAAGTNLAFVSFQRIAP